MQYQFLSHILSGAWMISPDVAAVNYQLLRGMFSGLVFESAPEPENARPYMASAGEGPEEKQISIISMRGTILKHDADCGPVGTRTLAARLRGADANPAVIAHVLICESGGGLAAAVPELTEAISDCSKPVVAWVDGMACSAAMYIISYCKEIIASRGNDMIGCIGTMIQFRDFPKFSTDSDNIITARIYATTSTDKNRDYEEALEGKFDLVRSELLDPINEQFVQAIKTNRPNCKPEELTGKTFFASTVVGSLIDAIGSLEYAIERAASLGKTNPTSHTHMEFEHLNAIGSVSGLVVEDGSASLNQEQLSDIDAALAAGTQAITERDQLREQVSQRDATITQQTGRITELENALAEKPSAPAATPAAVVPTGETKSSVEICQEHLNFFN